MMAAKKGITWTNERRKLSDLIPWERNPRTINNAQAERLVDSVETFGQVETLAIDCRNGVLNGHQRLNVLAGQYGMDYEVDVRVANRVLTERERQQLTVYLHRGTTGAWDFEELANSFEFDDLVTWGFSEEELLGLDFGEEPTSAGADTEPQIDKAEELRVKWNVSSGQLWALGEHRLICGDCTDAAVVARLMGGEKAKLIPTSPPYWVGKEYEKESGFDEIMQHINLSSKAMIGACMESAHIAINTGATTETAQGGKRRIVRLLLDWWQSALEPMGFYMRNVRIWAKQGGWTPYSPSQDVVDLNWEFLASFASEKIVHQNKIGESWALEGVWTVQPQTSSVNHSAPFPVEIPSRYILLYTNSDDVVYEPYSGSGTTLIACQNLGRKCRAVEISPAYVAVAIERFYQHTSIEPVLISN